MKAPSVQKCKKVIFTQIDPQRYVWRVAQNGQSDLPWVSSEPVTYCPYQMCYQHSITLPMSNSLPTYTAHVKFVTKIYYPRQSSYQQSGILPMSNVLPTYTAYVKFVTNIESKNKRCILQISSLLPIFNKKHEIYTAHVSLLKTCYQKNVRMMLCILNM